MSVPTGARGANLTVVFTLASELLALCIRTTANNRHFPHKFTRELGEPVVQVARRAFHAIYAANREKGNAEKRTRLVDDALDALTDLDAEITLNLLSFGLHPAKAGEMSDKVTETRARLIAWAKAIG